MVRKYSNGAYAQQWLMFLPHIHHTHLIQSERATLNEVNDAARRAHHNVGTAAQV